MKKHTSKALLILLLLALTQSSNGQVIFDYDSTMTFEFTRIGEAQAIATGGSFGSASGYKSDKGYKYLFVYLIIENNSQDKKIMDFSDFILFDAIAKKEYNVLFSMKTSAINVIYGTSIKLKGGKMVARKLVFEVPEEFLPKFIKVKDELLDIENIH